MENQEQKSEDVSKGAEETFRKHFEEGMRDGDYESFKRNYSTLTGCVISAMQEFAQQSMKQERDRAIQECIEAATEGRTVRTDLIKILEKLKK